jgi:hypothetical protein
MNSQLAPHPTSISQLFRAPPSAPPFDHQQTQNPPISVPPLPFRGHRNLTTSSRPPVLRAYPVENNVPQRGDFAGGSSSAGYGGQYNDGSEHMLRRKTPNGTLAAGYDGTPVQWSSKPPALKHVLLPLSSSQNGPPPPAQAPLHEKQRSNSLGRNQYYQHSAQYDSIASRSGIRLNSDPGNWAYPLPIPNPPSNFLDQFTMQQAPSFYPSNGMRVPTVLQPPYQPSPGPTASNDAVQYGPYWPDGSFVPYRPAAYREPDYHQSGHNHSLQPLFQTQSVGLPQPHRQASLNVDSAQSIAGPSFYSMDNAGGPRMQETRYITPQYSNYRPYSHISTYSTVTDGSRTPTAQSSSRPNTAQFREKTLSWAHSIYVDLLTFLHQSKKELKQTKHGRPYSKSSIYPKPPRQPASSFSNTDWINSYTSSAPETGAISPRTRIGGLSLDIQQVASSNFSGWPSNRDLMEPHYVPPFRVSQRQWETPKSNAREALEMLTNLCEQSHWSWVDGMLLGGCLAYGLEDYDISLDWYQKIIAIDPK